MNPLPRHICLYADQCDTCVVCAYYSPISSLEVNVEQVIEDRRNDFWEEWVAYVVRDGEYDFSVMAEEIF